jgi:hypothetical protein
MRQQAHVGRRLPQAIGAFIASQHHREQLAVAARLDDLLPLVVGGNPSSTLPPSVSSVRPPSHWRLPSSSRHQPAPPRAAACSTSERLAPRETAAAGLMPEAAVHAFLSVAACQLFNEIPIQVLQYWILHPCPWSIATIKTSQARLQFLQRRAAEACSCSRLVPTMGLFPLCRSFSRR